MPRLTVLPVSRNGLSQYRAMAELYIRYSALAQSTAPRTSTSSGGTIDGIHDQRNAIMEYISRMAYNRVEDLMYTFQIGAQLDRIWSVFVIRYFTHLILD